MTDAGRVLPAPPARHLPALFAVLLLLVGGLVFANPGAKESAPVDRPPSELKPGEFIWAPETVPSGPLVMVISLDEQRAYVYRNGLRIGVSTVSTGKKGKETPTGVFTILQKQKVHYSSLYDDAPMPFMQRLTWGGVALHAGNLPGYPASHGCIRLPFEFARQLFDLTSYGMTVVVAAAASEHAELAHPSLFTAVPISGGATPESPRLSRKIAYQWTPEKSPVGPLTILVGTSDRLVLVIRNGIEIGRARIGVTGEARFGTQAYVMLAGDSGAPSPVLPGRHGFNWQSIPLPGYAARPGMSLDVDAVRRVAVPPEFAAQVYGQMVPGTTLVLTDAPILPKTTGESMTVITAEDDQDDGAPSRPDDPGH
jgi:hypothetical protein